MNDLMTKSFLSYVDLKKAALKEDLEAADIEMSAAAAELSSAAATDANLRSFFEEAEHVRDEMTEIRSLLIRLQSSNDECRSLHHPDPLRSLRDRINSDILLVLRRARAIRDRLESMDRSNAANRRLSGCRGGTPVDRTRTSVTNGLRKKLRELMMDFQCLRQRMMAEYKDAVERRYFTVTGQVPAEEVIDRIIAEGEGEEVLRRAVAEVGKGEVAETVREIQGRHDAAKEVERSLLELHQVFLDMAVMVEAQGEQMDDIEHHVTHAAQYVKGGTQELGKAKGYQRSSRKWMCIAVIVLLIILLAVVVPVVASLGKS